jgi:hypothetical protein
MKFHTIRPVGVELFQGDRRTEITKLSISFHNFAKAPLNNETNLNPSRQLGVNKHVEKLNVFQQGHIHFQYKNTE